MLLQITYLFSGYIDTCDPVWHLLVPCLVIGVVVIWITRLMTNNTKLPM